MYEAVALWRRFPGEIASDLSRYHRLRIADWHQGRMLSFELLELCRFMDDEGEYKKALRFAITGSPWSERAYADFAAANEAAVLRAGQLQGVDSDQYGGRLFIPANIAKDRAVEEEKARSARASIFAMADISRQPKAS